MVSASFFQPLAMARGNGVLDVRGGTVSRRGSAIRIIGAGIIAGFLIGAVYALVLIALSRPDFGRTLPYSLLIVSCSINRSVLIAVLALVFLRVYFLSARWFGSPPGSKRANRIFSLLLALTVAVVGTYIALGYQRPLGRLVATVLLEGAVQAYRLHLLAVAIFFLVVFLFLGWLLGRVDYWRFDGWLRRVAASRRLGWCCVGILGLMIALATSGHALRKRMHNIIFITIDTLRQDHLGYAGYERNTSPNMEKLGAAGITFLQATSFCDWTLPSHDNLLTGRYPVSNVINRVPQSSELLPEILRRYGYRTAAFVSGEWCKRKFGLRQGFDFYDDRFEADQRRIGEYYDGILEWLKEQTKRPFFLWLHLFEPHFPYEGHAEHVYQPAQPTEFDRYNTGITGEAELLRLQKNEYNLQEKDIKRAQALYDSEISYIDCYLGRFWDDLRRLGLFDTSMIIVTSDHGEGFGEQGKFFTHAYNITEEITRVPLIIKMPGNAPGGKIVEDQVQTSDVVATILEVAGIPFKENRLSVSLLPLIHGRGSFNRKYAYSYGSSAQTYGIREGRFKLVFYKDEGKYGLYDIQSDPIETQDLSGEKPERLIEMKKELDKFSSSFRLFAAELRGEERPEIDEETRKRLMALGYIH